MENWAFEPEVLKLYAKHYKTGEVIPAALVEKIEKARTFNQGFITVEYLAASLLDMDWHTLTDADRAGRERVREGVDGQDPAAAADRRRATAARTYTHVFGPAAATRPATTLHLERGPRQGRVPGVQGEGHLRPGDGHGVPQGCSSRAARRTRWPSTSVPRTRARVEPLLVKRGLAERRPAGTY